jgi:hypothetical protein
MDTKNYGKEYGHIGFYFRRFLVEESRCGFEMEDIWIIKGLSKKGV